MSISTREREREREMTSRYKKDSPRKKMTMKTSKPEEEVPAQITLTDAERQDSRDDDDDESDNKNDDISLDIAIIGAGACGLNLAKTLLQSKNSNYRIAIFESKSSVGGLWNQNNNDDDDDDDDDDEDDNKAENEEDQDPDKACYYILDPENDDEDEKTSGVVSKAIHRVPIRTSDRRIYKKLIANTPKDIMDFRDFQYPMDVPIMPRPNHILKCLQRYAIHFDLTSIIQFNSYVVKCEKLQHPYKDSCWRITTRSTNTSNFADGVGNKNITNKSSYRSKRLVVCVGHHSEPSLPQHLKGLKYFQGHLLHSSAFDSFDQFDFDASSVTNNVNNDNNNQKTILLVGGGISGLDIADKIIKKTTATNVSDNKNGTVIINVIVSIRELKAWPHAISPILAQLKQGGNVRGGISHICKDGQVHFRPSKGEESILQKEDKTKSIEPIHADVIIFATGYRYSYPFLPNGGLGIREEGSGDSEHVVSNEKQDPSNPDYKVVNNDRFKMHRLYHRMIYVDDPSLAFMGIPAMIVSPFMLAEYQSIWYTTFIQGRLKTKNLTKAIMDKEIKIRNHETSDSLVRIGERTPIPGFIQYCNALAVMSGDYAFWKQMLWIRLPRILKTIWHHVIIPSFCLKR